VHGGKFTCVCLFVSACMCERVVLHVQDLVPTPIGERGTRIIHLKAAFAMASETALESKSRAFAPS
jgi:hypothetical protein